MPPPLPPALVVAALLPPLSAVFLPEAAKVLVKVSLLAAQDVVLLAFFAGWGACVARCVCGDDAGPLTRPAQGWSVSVAGGGGGVWW